MKKSNNNKKGIPAEFSLSDCDVDTSLRHFIAISGVFFQAGGT